MPPAESWPRFHLSDVRLLLETPQGPFDVIAEGSIGGDGAGGYGGLPAIYVEPRGKPERRLEGVTVLVKERTGGLSARVLFSPVGDEPLADNLKINGMNLAAYLDRHGELTVGGGIDAEHLGFAQAQLSQVWFEFRAVRPAGSSDLDGTLRFDIGRMAGKGGEAKALWEGLPSGARDVLTIDSVKGYTEALLGALDALLSGARAQGAAAFTLAEAGERLQVTLEEPLRLEAPKDARPVALTLEGTGPGPHFQVERGDGGTRFDLEAQSALSIDGEGLAPATAKLDGEFAILQSADGGLRLHEIDLREARFEMDPWPMNGGLFAIPEIRATGSGRPRALEGDITADLEVTGLAFPFLDLVGSTVRFAGRYAWAGHDFQVRLNPEDCAAIDAERITFAGFRFSPEGGPVRLCPHSDESAFAHLPPDDPETGPWLAFAASVPEAGIRVTEEAQRSPPLRIGGRLPRADLKMRYGLDLGTWVLDLETAGGNLYAEPGPVALGPLKAVGHLEGAGEALTGGKIELAQVEISDPTKAPRFATVALQGTARVEEGKILLDAGAQMAGRQLVSASGEHRIADGRGRLNAKSGRIAFAPDGLQPQTLFPILRGLTADVAGLIEADARFGWSPRGFTSGGHFAIDGLEFLTPFAAILGFSTDVELKSLAPLLTKGPQHAEVARIDLPVPLENGVLDFALEPGGILAVEKAQWPFLGGMLRLERDSFSLFDPSGENAVLAAENIDLAALITVANMQGLSGSGRLSGRLPVRLADGRILIEGGILEGIGEGTLSYRGQTAQAASAQGGASTSLLFQALDNFHWNELAVRLDGDLYGKLVLGFTVGGKNPNLYDGYPFRIRISTEGALMELLRSSTVGFRLRDMLDEAEKAAP